MATIVKRQDVDRARLVTEGLARPDEEVQMLAMIYRAKPEDRAAIVSKLNENAFFDTHTRIQFLALRRMIERSKDIDMLTLASESRRITIEQKVDVKVTPKDFGDLSKIELPTDPEATARTLNNIALLRDMFEFGRWIVKGVQDLPDTEELEKIIGEAQQKLTGIKPPRPDNRVRYGEEMPEKMMTNIRERRELFKNGQSVFINFPWDSWNQNIGIHKPGKLLMIAMPDGSGKSTVGAQIAWHVAEKLKHDCFIIALEDGIDSIEGRIASRIAGINYNKYLIGDITDQEEGNLERALMNFPKRLHFATMPGASSDEVIREMELQHMNGRLQVAIIDYFNAMSPSARNVKLYGGLYNSQKGDANDLVAFSTANKVPILTLDQMNKGFMKLSSKERKEQGRSNIFGGSGKFHASETVILGENTGPQAEDQPFDMIKWWVDKCNNGKKQFEFSQTMLHGRYVVQDIGA
jgi:replicative DNA helicase